MAQSRSPIVNLPFILFNNRELLKPENIEASGRMTLFPSDDAVGGVYIESSCGDHCDWSIPSASRAPRLVGNDHHTHYQPLAFPFG